MPQPIDTVRQVHAALQAGDMPAVLALTDPDITVRQAPELPWGGTFQGRDGYGRFAAGVARHLASAVTVERMIEAGEQVAVIGRTAGTVRASGRGFDVPLMHLYTVREGRIVEASILIDTPAMLDALAPADA